MEQRFDALLFDLDGLMIDTERISLDGWRKASAEFSVSLTETTLAGLVGLAHGRTEAYMTEQLGDADLARTLRAASSRHYHHAMNHGELPLKTGIENLLDWVQAQNIPRAVATSTQRSLADLKLGRSGLIRYFDVTVAGDEVAQTKPAPDLYLAAAAKLGVDPAGCIVLEDSYYGVLAARAAGMRVILVPDLLAKQEQRVEQAMAVCRDLNQALDLLKPLYA
jgi:HAD superfamily hydrolase (TIGR01509 family)